MTQDNDDILALVWGGVSLPTDVKGVTEINHNNHSETTHFESSHVETTHYETHKESHSESKIVVHEESHIDNHDDLLESVRRATNSFREFVESSGVVDDEAHEHHHEEVHHLGSGAAPAIHLEHHEEHYEDHHENHGIGNGVELSHAAIGMGVQIHDDHHDAASVISVRTGVSVATSVSVHSSVSQKSSVKGYDGISANGPDLGNHDHQSECLTEHTHEHESTICSGKAESVASTLSQSTLVQNYEVKVAAESNSHASTPVVPAKTATHDAVIEQFKHLHQRENSVCTSIQPSEIHLEEESVCSEGSEEGRIMEVKVTKYNFDDDSVKQVSNVLTYVPKEHSDSAVVNTLVHHEELKQEPIHHEEQHHYDAYHEEHHKETVQHHEQVLSYNHQEINTNAHAHHHGSEDEFGFEHVEYVEEKPRVAASGVSVKSATVHAVHAGPKLSHNVYETRRSIGSTSSSDNSTAVGGHAETVHQHVESVQTYRNVVQEKFHVTTVHKEVEHRDLVPNNVGPRVREDFRPVKIHREEVVVVAKKPVIAHVQPVVATQPEIIEHHGHEKHSDAYEEHHHHEHHHEDHHEHHHEHHSHSEIVHSEPTREEEVMYGPSVRDLKSIFDHGEPVNVHYGYHSIHHGATQKKHEIIVGELNHHDSHVEHHHEEVHIQPEGVVHVEEPVHQQKVNEYHAHKHHHHEDHHVHKHRHHDKHEKKHRRHHSRSHSHKESYHHEHQDHHVHKHHHNEDHHAHKHHHEEQVHHHEHVHQEPVHVVQEHIEIHEVHVPVQEYHAVEESVIPVSDALAIFGGGIRLRRPDHIEEQKSVRSSTQTTCTTVNAHIEEAHDHHSVVEVQETHVVGVVGKHRADTIGSGVGGRRSHAPTLTLVHQEHIVAPVVVPSPVAPAPVAAQRSSSNDQYQSVRVVKSVRNFVSQWGNKDFVPPQSPIIAVPRLPVSPKTPVAEVFVEAPSSASRKSTVTSCSSSVVSSKSTSTAASTLSKSSRSSTVTSSVTTASSKSSKRSSVASTLSASTLTSESSQSTLVSHAQPSIHNHIHRESEDEFEIVPVSERRALFEKEHRSFSASLGRHGELPPMVNLRD